MFRLGVNGEKIAGSEMISAPVPPIWHWRIFWRNFRPQSLIDRKSLKIIYNYNLNLPKINAKRKAKCQSQAKFEAESAG